MKKILVISPHPDDIELGCGGTLNKLKETYEIHLAVVCGEGDLTMVHSGSVVPFTQRKKEQEIAASILGIKTTHYLDFAPASKFDTKPIGELVTKLDTLLKQNNYDCIIIPYPSYNQDHTVTFNACIAALRPTKADKVTVLLYEQLIQYHGPQPAQTLHSKNYVTLTQRDVDAKTLAMIAHTSQVVGREKQILNEVEVLARMRGVEAGTTYAEMFHIYRSLDILK